jgi:hypothetical protein
MKTAAQIANNAKVRLQQDIVRMLRAGGRDGRHDTWRRIEFNKRVWRELATYDLAAKERKAHLNKVAFPDCNHADVDAALRAGNNLTKLYDVACGRAHVAKTSTGHHVTGKKGLKIVVTPMTHACD